MWHWWLELGWTARGVVVALVLGLANLGLGVYNAIRALGEDKRAARRERSKRITENIAARHGELRPRLRSHHIALSALLSNAHDIETALQQRTSDLPDIPDVDTLIGDVGDLTDALFDARERLKWEPRLLDSASRELDALRTAYRSFAAAYADLRTAITDAGHAYNAWFDSSVTGSRYNSVAERFEAVSAAETEKRQRAEEASRARMDDAFAACSQRATQWREQVFVARNDVAALLRAMDAFERGGGE